ncbi:hypothetical protein G6011_02836 [Alternaria panax]|uniref:Uncharacterized protein n=1 Tax=Alternaria panax TaxID=48097 RepID=A0AAD4FAD8_9PLEO|nr:hypothetical protein G6011_02836 [Alternaria panax]
MVLLTAVSIVFGVVVALGTTMPISPAFSTTVDIANTNINRDVDPNANAKASVTWQVRAQTFKEDDCGGAYTFLWLDPDICVDFDEGVKSMRVVGHDGLVGYDSFNVYSTIGCHSGPSLEPLDRNCYSVDTSRSIKLMTYS